MTVVDFSSRRGKPRDVAQRAVDGDLPDDPSEGTEYVEGTGPTPDLDELDAELEAATDPPPPGLAGRFFKCTDTGNAERLVAMFGDRIRYCKPWDKWLLWDEARWNPDVRGEIEALGKQVVRAIYAEASQCRDAEVREAIADWAHKSESLDKRRAMVKLAQSEPGIAVVPEELDADPWLLNCQNCTVDLRTGVPHEHRREDLITKVAAAPFDGAARSALWDRVLLEAMGQHAETVGFFQRSAGYSCTGLTSEEKLFMGVGPAGSSKSTIVQAIIKSLGDYAKTADFEAFLANKNTGGPKNEIARLAGARFVASIEVDKGRRIAQSLVKSLTGGDVVTARFLYCEAFEFAPTFKLWLIANDAPNLDDDDTGMWRRILRIPLDHVVPPEKRNPAVKAELIDVERSGAAILAWLVEGCLQWQAKGLCVPQTVKDATDGYRAEQDPLRGFIEEVCIVSPHVNCSRRMLRDAYEVWVNEAGAGAPLTGQEFTKRIRALANVGEKTVKGVRYWTGIGVLAQSAQPVGCREQRGAHESQ